MKTTINMIHFDGSDMNFVEKFGLVEAFGMVENHISEHNTPFIYDTYQLANLLQVSRKDLFGIVKNIDEHYRMITIPKKNGQMRKLSVPDDKLKKIQRIIAEKILPYYPVSVCAMAYRKRKTIYHNAYYHCDKKYLLKMDLTDFFSSIRFDRVYSFVFNSKRFSQQIGAMLTTLVCKDDVLPQGAPTSPAISNIVMCAFDEMMRDWCVERGITYTRYCDDITLSANIPLYGAFRKLSAHLEEMGFAINEKKTHFITSANRQTVTGLTVNKKVSVPAEYKRKLRQEVYYVLKHGFMDTIVFTNNEEFMSFGLVDIEKYRQSLIGRINYVLQIEPMNKFFSDARVNLLKGRR